MREGRKAMKLEKTRQEEQEKKEEQEKREERSDLSFVWKAPPVGWISRANDFIPEPPARRDHADPTADAALGRIMREERRKKRRAKKKGGDKNA